MKLTQKSSSLLLGAVCCAGLAADAALSKSLFVKFFGEFWITINLFIAGWAGYCWLMKKRLASPLPSGPSPDDR